MSPSLTPSSPSAPELSQKDISQLLDVDPLRTKPGVESPLSPIARQGLNAVSYTHLRAHET